MRGILSGIFTKAREWKLWDGPNPCEGVDIGRKKAKRVQRIPNTQDLLAFLAAFPDTSHISGNGARLIVLTACTAGLRESEVLALTRSTINAEERTLKVDRRWRRGDEDEPKTEASRRVRQIGALANELLTYSAEKAIGDYIFTRPNGEPLDDRDLQRDVFRPAAEATGIYFEGFGMHVFRRLNVTWRQQEGAMPIEAQKAAGHSSLDMTLLYTQTEDARERDHVEKILERLQVTEQKERLIDLETMDAAGPIQ